MKINKRLNLVIPVETGDDVLYVHSMPISRDVFERYFKVIGRAFNEIYGGGYSFYAGPRVAAMIVRDIAQSMGLWEGERGVERGLVGEVRRLTNCAVPADGGGWQTLPIQDAVTAGHVSADDMAEVDNALMFFTVASAMHKQTDLPGVMTAASRLWGGLVTSLNITEYVRSLKTLTEDENTGATAMPPEAAAPKKVSSIPY